MTSKPNWLRDHIEKTMKLLGVAIYKSDGSQRLHDDYMMDAWTAFGKIKDERMKVTTYYDLVDIQRFYDLHR